MSERAGDADRDFCIDGFDLKTAASVIAYSRYLVNGDRLGTLATVDAGGAPCTRWMGTLSLDHFPQLLALTSPNCAKVRHLKDNAKVDWMFWSDNRDAVLNLRGTAVVVDDTATIKRTWKVVADKSKAFFLDAFVRGAGMVVIETRILEVLLSFPARDAKLVLKLSSEDGEEVGPYGRFSYLPLKVAPVFSEV